MGSAVTRTTPPLVRRRHSSDDVSRSSSNATWRERRSTSFITSPSVGPTPGAPATADTTTPAVATSFSRPELLIEIIRRFGADDPDGGLPPGGGLPTPPTRPGPTSMQEGGQNRACPDRRPHPRVPQLNGAPGHVDRHRRRSPTCRHCEMPRIPGHTFEPCSKHAPAEMQTRHVHAPSGPRSRLRPRRHAPQAADLRREHLDLRFRLADHGQAVSIPSGTPRLA